MTETSAHTTAPIRVVAIDGHTMTRYGLAQLLGGCADLEMVAEVSQAADAVRVVATMRPNVVTLDVTLPDGDGLQLARELRDRYPDLGIVLLTSDGQDDILFRALETGVSAFVTKSAPAGELLGAIRHAAVAATSFTAKDLAPALARRTIASAARLTLSPREGEVLALLGQGLSVPAIARSMFVSQSTAKTYVARLYEKLGASNRSQALMTGLRQGLITNELVDLAPSSR